MLTAVEQLVLILVGIVAPIAGAVSLITLFVFVFRDCRSTFKECKSVYKDVHTTLKELNKENKSHEED